MPTGPPQLHNTDTNALSSCWYEILYFISDFMTILEYKLDKQCKITPWIILWAIFHSVHSPRMLSAADIALSTCEITMKPQSCSRRDCGRKVVRIVAVSDFIHDGDPRTRIITEPARSQSPLWKLHDPADAFVSNLLSTLLRRERINVFKNRLSNLCWTSSLSSKKRSKIWKHEF